jgi:hypothetical protein
VKGRALTGSRGSEWSTEDLLRRVSHALDIAAQAVNRLTARGYTDPSDAGNNLRPEKLISETGLLLLGASVAGEYSEVQRRLQGVAERLIPHARSERMLLGVCLEPALALDYAAAHICLARLGYPDSGFDAVLRRSLASQARAGRERPPHRVLEQEWLVETWNGSTPDLGKRRLPTARSSVLSQPMDLLGGSREDIYAFTHALMYVAGFNLEPRRFPRPIPAILAEADAALARCLDEQDYDLGGEVLLAGPLIGRPWSAGAAFGFRVLAHVEDRAGFLPSPSTRLQRLNELNGDERTDYLLATTYHTAYVMGLLCAAVLRSGTMPPLKIPPDKGAPGNANKILQFLDADGRRTHWRDELDQLRTSERDAIAGFLLAIALRRKASGRDFSAFHEVLVTGLKLGLADSPIASQAAELLDRLTVLAPMLPEARETQGSARLSFLDGRQE